MRSEGFPFMVWGSGGWTPCSLRLLCARAIVASRVASRRGASLIPCYADLRLGAARGWRCAMGIAAG